jgi:hypothetical protein
MVVILRLTLPQLARVAVKTEDVTLLLGVLEELY